MTSKILCPVDFSEPSLAGARLANDLARQQGTELVLLHVCDQRLFLPAEDSGRGWPQERAAYARAVRAQLAELVAEFEAQGTPTVGATARGRPHATIVEVSRELDADLIVMGTHGRSGVAKLVHRSVAERVVRAASVPVLTLSARKQQSLLS